ncbi:MAG: hypothetical protein IPL46_12805 [Saprospiraceae bacterium]|nr:hypothetical protein [Saprospiraceae bacterium]
MQKCISSAKSLAIMLTMATCTAIGQPQDSLKSLIQLSARYGAGLPMADLKDRFAEHFTLGGSVAFLSKNNFYLGANYDLLFGNQVREDVLSNLRTIEGGIIGSDMQFASIFLRERGHQFSIDAGHLVQLRKNSRHRSGFLLVAGLGYLVHKIRIVDDFDSVVQLQHAYLKGYDRLSSGWTLNQKISYMYLSEDKLINFYISISVAEAFTRDRRQFNYNQTGVKINRFDVLTGIQLGWIIPIYLTPEIRYY